MKKTVLLFVIVFILISCERIKNSFVDEKIAITDGESTSQGIAFFEEKKLLDNPYITHPNLDEVLKIKIIELQLLWEEFVSSKNDDIDPTENFHNSAYIAQLKNFLSERDSVKMPTHYLAQLLGQNDLVSFDKKLSVGDKEYSIRVIRYNVDFYVKVITDVVDIQNKYIFVQCWREDEFYFTVLSDGDIHTATDFIPLEIDDTLQILLTGYSSTYYPVSPFLWAWRLHDDGFQPSNLFNFGTDETDQYLIYDSIDLSNNPCRKKWTVQTDGSHLIVAKRSSAEGSELWASDLLNVYCETDEENKVFSFVSFNRDGEEDSTFQLRFSNGQFIIE